MVGLQSSADGYCRLYALISAEEVEHEDEERAEFSLPKNPALQPFIAIEPLAASTSKYRLLRIEEVPSAKINVAEPAM